MADDQTQELAAMLGDLPPDTLAAIIQALKTDADNAAATPVVAWPDASIEHKVEALVAVIRRISAPAFHWIEEELQKFQALDSQKKKEAAVVPAPVPESQSEAFAGIPADQVEAFKSWQQAHAAPAPSLPDAEQNAGISTGQGLPSGPSSL